MPHAALRLLPGVDTTKTVALNEAAISESTLIRFVPDRTGGGLPQKLGGWTRFLASPFDAPVRALHAWADLNETNLLSIGTANGAYTYSEEGGVTDRTYQAYTIDTAVDFSTTIGLPEVIVTDVGSNISSFDSVNIITPVSVGGVILSGYYNTRAISPDTYQITAVDSVGNPVNATATVANGGAVPDFTTTVGALDVTVDLADHGYSVGDTFTILVETEVGGISLYGNYTVLTVPSTSQFTIKGPAAASSAATVSMNSGMVRFEYFIGQPNTGTPVGFGDGGFGDGGFGVGVTTGTGREVATTAAVTVGTIATIDFSAYLEVPVGTIVQVAGVTPAEYNGTWTVTAATYGATSTVSFDIGVAAGPQTVAGTATFIQWGAQPATDWSLDNWGEDMIASPHMKPIFYWQPSGGVNTVRLSRLPNAPSVNEGCFVAMPQRQIIAYGSTFTGIQDPLLVRWCDVSDNTSWVGTVTNQAGSYRVAKGSKIVGGMQGPQQGLLWTDIGVWSMQYIGPPYVYAFNELGAGCGLVGRRAAASLAGVVYWMSQSQFYKLAGGWPEPIRCPVWDNVFQSLDLTQREKIRCAANSQFGEVTWYYCPDDGSTEPTRYVKYNTLIDQWDYGTLTRTAWLDQSVFGPPLGGDDTGYIYQHETSNDADGNPMTSGFRTGYFALAEGNYKVFVDQIWADMKWAQNGDEPDASVQITFYTADYPSQTPSVYGPYTMTAETTYLTPRFRARLVAIDIRSSDSNSFWRLGNIRYRSQPDGVF